MIIRITFVTSLLCAIAASSCTKTRPSAGTDGATHFLVTCDANADCGPLACLCGVCSKDCSADAQCTGLDEGASCLPASAASCGGSERACALECDDRDDCSEYGARAQCQDGRCTRPVPDVVADGGVSGSGGSGIGGSSGRGGSGGSSTVCTRMDAVWDGTECLRELGYTWDGATCRLIQCGCDGDDCAALYDTQSECEAEHEGCAECRKMDARSDGTKCLRTEGYSWNGIACEEVVCGCTGGDCSAIYASQRACEDAHRSCTPLTMCASSTDCSLMLKECCDCQDLSLAKLTAVSTSRGSDYEARICDPTQPCLTCGGISPVPGRFVPHCVPSSRWEGGECSVRDLGSLPCTQEVGCRVRVRGCCECGADVGSIADLLAIPNGSDVSSMWCTPGEACDACLPSYPEDVTARCGASGFCELLVAGEVFLP